MDHATAAPDAPRICPFLHAAVADGTLGDPIRWPDEANRCTALGDAAPQSIRQQEYACLAASHVNCPRFVRGVHLMADAPPPAAGAGLQLTPAVLAALLVLAAVVRPVRRLRRGQWRDEPAARAGREPDPAGRRGVVRTQRLARARREPRRRAMPRRSHRHPRQPTSRRPPRASRRRPPRRPWPRPSRRRRRRRRPGPSSNRYALLEPCGDAPDCWIYTIRAGDNLVSIARYFGVPFDTVTELNPWTRTTELVAGQELRLPPPTR